jgi:hypothetical protein
VAIATNVLNRMLKLGRPNTAFIELIHARSIVVPEFSLATEPRSLIIDSTMVFALTVTCLFK